MHGLGPELIAIMADSFGIDAATNYGPEAPGTRWILEVTSIGIDGSRKHALPGIFHLPPAIGTVRQVLQETAHWKARSPTPGDGDNAAATLPCSAASPQARAKFPPADRIGRKLVFLSVAGVYVRQGASWAACPERVIT